MKELEEENSSLRSELGAELAKLADIDAETQERMLSVTQRMGAGLLDPELLAKFARKQDLSLPLFQHAAQAAAAAEAKQKQQEQQEQLLLQQQQADEAALVGDNKLPLAPPTAAGGLRPTSSQTAAASTALAGDHGSIGGPIIKQEREKSQQPAHLGQIDPQAWAAAGLDLTSTNAEEPVAARGAEATGPTASSKQPSSDASLERAGGEPAAT